VSGLTFNGKSFDPDEFTEALKRGVMEKAAEHIRSGIAATRDPATGEFPTVVAAIDGEDRINLRMEGSNQMLSIVANRMNPDRAGTGMEARVETPVQPRVFLSYAWEDTELAESIARALQANGIETWWAGWSISVGDSLPQKIDEGLGECTHFIVLLTAVSVTRPWVRQEMDAGLVRRISAQARFIPLRHSLAAQDLPPLLRPIFSPEVNVVPDDIRQLVDDIHGVSRKPPLGRGPAVASAIRHADHSPAASRVAEVFARQTVTARYADPQLSIDALVSETGLTRDDVIDGLHELHDVVDILRETVLPKDELFVRFDEFCHSWKPSDDALRIAADMVNTDTQFGDVAAIAERYGWAARRMNPAVAFLMNRELVQASRTINSGPWITPVIRKTDDTRRFVRSRSA
jgi:hypothetical protein